MNNSRRRARLFARIAVTTLLAVALSLFGSPSAQAKRTSRARAADWFGPVGGDFELSVAGNIGRLISSKFTAFDIGVGFGIFATDWLELGAFASLGYSTKSTPSATSNPLMSSPLTAAAREIGMRQQALAVAPISSSGGGLGWYGSSLGFARIFPFAFDKTDPILPYWLGPFIGLSAGGIFAQSVSPFFTASASLGVNFYLTDQIALTPEIGYALIVSTDRALEFDGSKLEHAIAASWALSFFFS